MVAQFAPPVTAAEPAIGAIVPHGSYQHSGAIVGQTLGRVAIPERCLILGSNHTGVGSPWSVMSDGAYQTPIGEVPIDQTLARALLEACPLLEDEAIAHHGEHAIEVVLPFLQWRRPSVQIVPLITSSEDPQACQHVAQAIGWLIGSSEQPVGVLISADLSHYEPHQIVRDQDADLLAMIRQRDAEEFLRLAQERSMRLCGGGAIACGLWVARDLGAREAQVIRYGTSAEAGGDPGSAIGFAGVILN